MTQCLFMGDVVILGHKCSVFVSIALSLRKVSQSCLTVQGISLSINLLLKNSSSLAINDQH